MPIVVDVSVIVAGALSEAHPRLDAIFGRLSEDDWIVPSLWWFEIRNAFLVNERRSRLQAEETTEHLRDLARTPVVLDAIPDETAIMALARRHRLTVYDAAYLELALREQLDLATLDASLADAARREGVAVVGDPT
jgi:predicted nucleic acid-binding protein